MQVGILQFFGWRDRSVPLTSVYQSALERFSVMDETGYDAVWLAEHHFSGFSVCPSVHIMGTTAAARTKRLPERHGGFARPILQPAAARRGGGTAGRALGWTSQLGRGTGL